MDDDGIFVLLSMKEMRNSGQQYCSVCLEWAWASIQGNIRLQFLFQQPGDQMTKFDQNRATYFKLRHLREIRMLFWGILESLYDIISIIIIIKKSSLSYVDEITYINTKATVGTALVYEIQKLIEWPTFCIWIKLGAVLRHISSSQPLILVPPQRVI